jgi:hypothetical protein
MARLLREGFATVTLVASDDQGPTVQNLYEIMGHPDRFREKSIFQAIDRIIGEAGTSDFIFVGPSKRSACDQANSHLTQRNMVRLS